jgi:O-acetyl-ADP-ribose deacetylase (regulator of RNase III)
MKIILSAIEPGLADAWERFCGAFECVAIHRGSILDLKCDAVVSPANSFGFMDGGMDMLYSLHFGWGVQGRLQALIRERHQGELLVGMAEIVETESPDIPYLISAPTMRVPMILDDDTANPYLAVRAVLLLIQSGTFGSGALEGERIDGTIETVAFPGLGTGVGRVSFETCAKQMRVAIEDVILGQNAFPSSWSEAQERHQRLYTNQIRDLQRE